ncbi:ORF3 [Grizzly bear anellovirus 1]|nr:ORF3 [Grizzly bear anellovirus 1]
MKDKTGPSEKQTPVPSASPPAKPASYLRGILKTPGSSQKKPLKELLKLVTPEKKEFWRSSPGLFSSVPESESESDGETNKTKNKRQSFQWVSQTPTYSTKSLSGVESLTSSDDEGDIDDPTWEKWLEGGSPPPNTPPDNEIIYKLLRSLE